MAGQRRVLIVGGAGIGLLVLVLLATTVLFGGNDLTFDDVPVTPAPTTTTTAPGPVPPDLETFEVFTTKNPFAPLVALTTEPAPTGPTAPTTPTAPTSPTDPGTSPTTAPTGDPDGTTTTTLPATNGEPRPMQRVALLEVFVDTDDRLVANVRVNGTVYKVGAGDRFASNYEVVSLSQADRCGEFLFGDDQFRLCEGEELIK